MNKQEKSQQLEERLVRLSVDTINGIRKDSTIPQSVRTQLIRSVTSIGANYSEANNASSKADFKNKLYISKKEAAESLYWIKVMRGLKNEPEFFSNEYTEIDEVLRILQKAITTMTKDNNDKR